VVLKLGQFGKWSRNTGIVLNCGAGEGWRKISWTDRARNEEILHSVKKERNTLHTAKRKKANWLVTACVGTAF